MEEIRKVKLSVTVEYTVSKELQAGEEMESVISLSVSPNFHTKEEGIELRSVIVSAPDGTDKAFRRIRNAHGVFPILNGCSQECIFEGTAEECTRYVKEHKPGEYIISPLD